MAQQSISVFEDEASIVALAGMQTPGEIIDAFLHGAGQHKHPPLYDLFLNGWMSITDDARALLRLPSVIFYCLALWFIGATAQLLWGKRLLAVVIAMAWPAGLFLGTPAHWSAMAMLWISAATWAYVRWRQSQHPLALVSFTLFGIALVYTNYLGWAFLAALGVHLIIARPGRKALTQAGIAGAMILVAFLPILGAFLHAFEAGTKVSRSPTFLLADAGYHGYSLLASEAVAPWYWPSVLVALGIAGLIYVSIRTPQTLWLLGILALVFLSSALLGILGGKRIGLFAPWLLLYLTGLISITRVKRKAVIALALIFATGWAGITSQRWYATFRYIEPWEEIVSTVENLSQPGDLIVCNHPSYYFYARYLLGWQGPWIRVPWQVTQRADRYYAPLWKWEEAVRDHDRIVYVKTVLMPYALEEEKRMTTFLSANYRLTNRSRYLEDRGSDLKKSFLSNQPRWRIEILRYAIHAPLGHQSRTSCPSRPPASQFTRRDAV